MSDEVQPASEESRELTPEEVADVAFKARIELLQEKIRAMVKELMATTDFTVEEFGYATDLFKGLVTILTHGTEQHEALIAASNEANNKYLLTKLSDLTPVSNEKPAEEIKA